MANTHQGRRRLQWLSLLLALVLVAAACGGSDDEASTTTDDGAAVDEVADEPEPEAEADEPEPEADEPEAEAEADEPEPEAEADEPEAEAETDEPEPEADEAEAADAAEPVQIAYLSASSANTWLASSRDAMEDLAGPAGLEIVEFDAGFDPAAQQQQFQDVVASGQYAGIVLVSLVGSGSIPDIEAALDAGIEVVVLNQVVGDDLATVEPQVDGLAAAVFEPPQIRGERLGELTLEACVDRDPCNVVYFYGIRGIPLDEAVRAGWDAATAGSTVTVVAEAEGQYLGPDVALTAMQDVLVRTDDIDLVVGPDQSMQGVELALDGEGGVGDVRILGFGGSSYSIDAITDGRWWGGVYGAPYTEGELAMQAMIDALAGTDTGGVDPADSTPNGGLMTPENIGEFTAQWDG